MADDFLSILPGIIESAHRDLNDESGALARRVRKTHARGLDLIAREHARQSAKEALIERVEKFEKDMEAAVGRNSPPTEADDFENTTAEEVSAARMRLLKAQYGLDKEDLKNSSQSSAADENPSGAASQVESHPAEIAAIAVTTPGE